MYSMFFALGLFLSAAGSLVTAPAAAAASAAATAPAAADWAANTMTMEATEQNPMAGKSDFIYVDGLKGVFAFRFDYENWSILKGNPFSGVAYINCISGAFKYYWNSYGLDEETKLKMTRDFTRVFCRDYKKFYPDSPALK